MEPELKCPHCQNDDRKMIDIVKNAKYYLMCICLVCSKMFEVRLDE